MVHFMKQCRNFNVINFNNGNSSDLKETITRLIIIIKKGVTC